MLVSNVADSDTEMRARALGADAHRLPCAVFFDFIVAFPSADHGFLMDALEDVAMPAGAVHFVRSM